MGLEKINKGDISGKEAEIIDDFKLRDNIYKLLKILIKQYIWKYIL